MHGLLIQYDFMGDEKEWEVAVKTFIDHINKDKSLKGSFSYIVARTREGSARVHLARWSDEGTLAYLQSQPFFNEFAEKVKGFGGILNTTGLVPFMEAGSIVD